jgi:cephalosporin hydroxylase
MSFMNEIKKFRQERQTNIKKLSQNKKLKKLALNFFIESWKDKYSYNFDWLGRPIIQIPQDIVALQEIIWKVKPDLIIETGIAHGGGLIFYASMLELIGKGKVLGIDIDIREYNRKEIEKHKMAKRIKMIGGSSVDKEVIKEVTKIVRKHKKIMVCLDSFHTHEHVLKELNLYSKFVSRGSYLVVFDTIIEEFPQGFFKDRPWDKGNNPATAVKAFLKNHKNFAVDKNIENKLLITCTPGGFLKRIK